MFGFFKKMFKKEEVVKKEIENVEIDFTYHTHGDLSRLKINKKDYKEELYNKDKKTILIVDDYEEMGSLYNNIIREIKEEYNRDVFEDFNVIFSIGDNCGKDALEFCKKHKVDIAILDITLREILKIKTPTKEYFTALDGFDIEKELKEENKDLKFVFLTAHNIENSHDKFTRFFNKFNGDLIKHYINKLDSDKCETLYNLFYGDEK